MSEDSSQKTSFLSLMRRANSALENNDDELARDLYRSAYEEFSIEGSESEALILAEGLQKTESWDQAGQICGLLLRQELDVEDWIRLISLTRVIGATDTALAALEKLRELPFVDPGLPLKIAGIYREMQKFPEALAVIDAGLKERPKNWWLKFDRERVKAKIDPLSVNLQELKTLIEAQPSRPAGHRFRIAWLKSQKRFEEAEDCIKFFSAACPDEGDLTREMAELAAASNDPKRVVEILVDFQNKGALDYKTQIVLADAYMALADETALSHMLARLPGDCVDADASILKARILIALGLNMDAMPPLKNALHQNPNDQHLWALYIQSMTDLGQAREVIAEVAKLDSTVLQRPAIRLRIAGAYWAIGEYDEALDALGQAENGPILRQITNYTSQLGRLDLAEQAISNWRNGTENDSVIGHFAQAMICRNVMDFAGCLDHTEAAIELAPDRAGLFTLMGHSLMCLSRPGEALEAFEKAYLLDRASGAPKIVHKYGIFSEILNELRLEPEMTTQLEAIAAQAPKNQIQSFSDLLRKYRDNSAAALSLLISLRRAGHFEVSDLVPTGDMRNIPKVIYQYWETGEPPQDLSAAMKKLHQCHSDFDIKLYDCSTARQFIKRLGEPNLLRAFNMSEHAAERADLLRLVLLREYGGIYLDCDDICLGYLPDIIPSDAEFVTYQEVYGSTGNNFLAAQAGNKFIEEALEEAVELILSGTSETIWMRTGPGLLSRVVARGIAFSPQTCLPSGHYILSRQTVLQHLAIASPFAYKLGAGNWQKIEAKLGRSPSFDSQKLHFTGKK